jgi:proprotein convertase subtilisin/kexin type 5
MVTSIHDFAEASQCVGCQNFLYDNRCVAACPVGTYSNASRVCVPCDSQCSAAGGCVGAGPAACLACVAAVDGSTCVAECPIGKYIDAARGCRRCSSQCAAGCSGPSALECASCAKLAQFTSSGVECVGACGALQYSNGTFCLACNRQCASGCSGPAASQCVGACLNFRLGNTCITSKFVDLKFISRVQT